MRRKANLQTRIDALGNTFIPVVDRWGPIYDQIKVMQRSMTQIEIDGKEMMGWEADDATWNKWYDENHMTREEFICDRREGEYKDTYAGSVLLAQKNKEKEKVEEEQKVAGEDIG